ncbi:MAG: hypothetical protein LQ350_004338 [Teloschistes chrysophthalmus]|nr:MAG: hypothetical protein LQ350_004338 [Niorma chrysophthalma]
MASDGIEELKVIPNARQKASDRFDPVGEGPIAPASLAPYRNNLAALSKYYNLFFVASRDTILVYKPQGQHQILISPEIAIAIAKTDTEGAQGYISETHPHAANHLVVADLGLEEVLVVSCDDGDVVAYTTLSIYQEIDRQRSSDQDPRPPHAWDDLLWAKLRPFLLRNVAMSAWGLAVHEKYRMIAVSSNAHKIHVFIFALSYPLHPCLESLRDMGFQVEDPPHVYRSEWDKFQCWDPFFPRCRSRNLELILDHHMTNIPSIAFYNSHDPGSTDVFLVSTDIHGETYIWDVWNRRVIYDLDTSTGVPEDRAWGLLCLDPYFCRQTTSSEALFGGSAFSEAPSRLDITETTHARAATDLAVTGGSVYNQIWSTSPLQHLVTAANVLGDLNDSDSDMDVNSIESEAPSDMDVDTDADADADPDVDPDMDLGINPFGSLPGTDSLSAHEDQEPDTTTDGTPNLSNAQTTGPSSTFQPVEWFDPTQPPSTFQPLEWLQNALAGVQNGQELLAGNPNLLNAIAASASTSQPVEWLHVQEGQEPDTTIDGAPTFLNAQTNGHSPTFQSMESLQNAFLAGIQPPAIQTPGAIPAPQPNNNVHTLPRLDPSPRSSNSSSPSAAKRPRLSKSPPPPPPTLPFHVLHTNRATIRLFHNIPTSPVYHNTESPSFPNPPHEIVCRSPFDPKPRSPYAKLLSRLNMVHQIPDLGLVVIGDQSGRVGLFSLTCLPKTTTTTTNNNNNNKTPKSPNLTNKNNKNNHTTNNNDGPTQFGLRLETILPLQDEEKVERRPRKELLGVAVGPVQGYEFERGDGLDPSRRTTPFLPPRRWGGERKWRVLLYYGDHTVMSYEICRPAV